MPIESMETVVAARRRAALSTPDDARVRFFIHVNGRYCLRDIASSDWWLLSPQGDGWTIHPWVYATPLPPAPDPVEHEYHWRLASIAVMEAIELAGDEDHVPILESLLASNAEVTP